MATVEQRLAQAEKRLEVPVRGGDLRVVSWGDGDACVVGLHGLTASHALLRPLARRLGDDVTLLAPDLRGRGASSQLPGPYGMRAHVADLQAILDHLAVPRCTLVGISMGGYIATLFAADHPDRVDHVVLVDAGIPIPLPAGIDLDDYIKDILGPSIARLDMTFPTRDAYRDFWRQHPSLKDDWDEDVEAYVDYDLVGEEPNLRPRVAAEAIRQDSIDILSNNDNLAAALANINCPVTLLRATRGVLNEPEPLLPDELVDQYRGSVKDLHDEVIEDTNHFSIVFGDRPGSIVADRVRSAVGQG